MVSEKEKTLEIPEKPEKQQLIKSNLLYFTAVIADAVLAVEGVHKLSDSITENISKMIGGREDPISGIKVAKSKGEVSIQIYIIVEYGSNIPQVAWEVQTAVQKAAESRFMVVVDEVNIHITGVHRHDVDMRIK